MLHYIGILVLIYIVALVLAPQQVLAVTAVAIASAWTLIDWTTVLWTP